MKKVITTIFAVVLLIFVSCNKSSNPVSNNTNQNSAAVYYPGNTGSSFNYSVQIDSLGGQSSQGERTVSFTGSTTIDNTSYFIQSNSTVLPVSTTNTNSYFRRTDGGVFFFVDTTGLYSYLGSYTAVIDKELDILSGSLDNNVSWKVFKLNVLSFSIIDLTAYYKGSEGITLNLNSGQVNKSAEKINYIFTLIIPDIGGPIPPKTSSFEATCWFVKDLGLVKSQGNLTIINAISGYKIDFADTTKTILQNLTSYEIK
jgi:hypothetical protein